MEDINTLKSENEKLQGRLKKAVDVFNVQKNEIARLSKERDEAREALKEKEKVIVEFECRMHEQDQKDAKFFEALSEIDTLNEKISSQEQKIGEQNQKIEEQNKEISNAREKLEGMMNSMTTLVGSIKTGADAIMSNAKDILSSIKSSKIL